MEETIDLKEYLLILKKKAKMIAAITLLCGIISGLISFFVLTPVYQANTSLIVNKGESNIENESEIRKSTTDDLNYELKLALTYTEIIKSRKVMTSTIEKLNLDMDYKDLSDSISVESIPDTQIIQVSVKNTNPIVAAKICNTIPDIFTQELKRIVKADGVEVIDEAVIPKQPIKPNKTMNVAIAMLLGFMGSIFVILVLEALNTKLKEPKDIEEKLKMPLLGVVPYTDKKQNIIEENQSKEAAMLGEAYTTVRTNIGFSDVDNKVKTILFTSTRQNEGKSTLIANIANSFSKLENSKVLLVDLDLRNPTVHRLFGVSNTCGMMEHLKNDKPLEECVHKIKENLHILTSGAIPPNPGEMLSSTKMSNFFDSVREKYDYVFIDTPPVGILVDATIISKKADAVVYVVGTNQTDLSHTQIAVENLKKAEARVIGGILNKYKSSENVYGYYGYYYQQDEEHVHKHKKKKHTSLNKKIKKVGI